MEERTEDKKTGRAKKGGLSSMQTAVRFTVLPKARALQVLHRGARRSQDSIHSNPSSMVPIPTSYSRLPFCGERERDIHSMAMTADLTALLRCHS